MSVVEFLSHLADLDIRLWVEGENLRFSAPEGAFTPDIKQQVIDRKLELIEFLAQAKQVSQEQIPAAPRDGNLPLSYAQQRLWFLHQLDPDDSSYNMPAALRIKGDLNIEVLRRAINEILRRHEMLRTSFYEIDGDAFQRIHPPREFTLQVEDISTHSNPEASLAELALQEAFTAFDLSDSILRIRLLQISSDEYALLSTMHHISSDGWSMGILVTEIATLYRAFMQGQPSPFPDLQIQYADFAHWQKQHLNDEKLEQQLAFWKTHLADSQVLQFPTDRPRPAVLCNAGDYYEFTLDTDTANALRELSRQYNATLFMTLFAAYNVLLHRYSLQDDICVGTPIANRDNTALEPLIGCFINTLAIRTDLSGNPSFEQLLQQLITTSNQCFANKDIPFEHVVDKLVSKRDLSTTPLFQTMFILQNAPGDQSVSLPGIEFEPIELNQRVAKFDLMFTLEEHAKGINCSIEYRSSLFDKDSIARIAEHFTQIARQITQSPGEPIDTLTLTTDSERNTLLQSWNNTETAISNVCVHQLIEQQVSRTPEAIAIRCGDDTLSYGELNQRANQLARHLLNLGTLTGDYIGVCLYPSTDVLVALLAIQKARAAYIPMDPAYPDERLAHMQRNAHMRTIITQATLAPRFGDANVHLIALDDVSGTLQNLDSDNLDLAYDPEDPLYTVYTSGSTGLPKGAGVRQRNEVNLLEWYVAEYAMTAADKVLVISPLGFDLTQKNLFALLLCGGEIVFPEYQSYDHAIIIDTIAQQGITLLNSAPSAFYPLVEQNQDLATLASLRCVLFGGEPIRLEYLKPWLNRDDCHTKIVNMYGPTECTDIAATFTIDAPRHYQRAMIPIGKPNANIKLFVLDDHLQLAPIGVSGELYIGGAGVGMGYLNNDEMTAASFIDNPFGEGKIYRTGDLVRYHADGNIEYLGRRDFQVKIRGLRIDLGEIEAVLQKHHSVKECIVDTKSLGDDNTLLVAYVVGETAAENDELLAELRQHVAADLPEYMIPNVFMFIDEIPLSPNGKANRRALPEPDLNQLRHHEYIAPQTQSEIKIAAIWSEILGIEQIGTADNFFELGGHSLLATRVVSRLKKELGLSIQLRKLFELRTLAELAHYVDAGEACTEVIAIPRIDRAAVQAGDLKLSFAQQRLWMVDNILKGSQMYNLPVAWRIRGALDHTVLQQAINSIIERHEILRTSFAQQKLQPYQVIHPFTAMTLPVRDISEAQLEQTIAELSLQTFDLSQGPLLHCELLRLGDNQHVLFVNMHHSISDGWSLSVFTRELLALYHDFKAGKPNPLPALTIQYADYANWQHDYLSGTRLDQQINYWQQQLQNLPVLQLPADHPRPPTMTAEGYLYNFSIEPQLGDQLREFCRQQNITLFMLLLGAFNVLLYRYSGQDDFAIGTPIANRSQEDIEALIGLFVNTLVMRTAIDAEESFTDYIQRVRQTTLDAYQHQDAPFEKVVEALALARDMSHTPLFQVMFSMLSAQQGQIGQTIMDGLEIGPLFSDSANNGECLQTVVKFDLQLGITDQGEGNALLASIEGRQALFDQHSFARLASHFVNLLEQIISVPTQSIGTLNLATEAEQQQLLATSGDAWNATSVHYTSVPTLHSLFEAQVARTPAALAVKDAQRSLSYQELNDQANQLAQHLICHGVGPDTMVGVAMERSVDMSVALLAVLKAGGAYVPFDPGFPADRLAYMAEDCQLSILLSQQHIVAREDVSLPADAAILCIENRDIWRNQPTDNPGVAQTGEHLFNVIFTSGSTGKPKGVMVPHQGIINRLLWMQYEYPLDSNDRVLQKTPYSFDVSVWELFWPLIVGAQLIYAKPDGHKDPDYLRDTIKQEAISTLHFVPSMLGMFLQAKDVESCASIRRTFCSGEALQLEHERRYFQRLPHAELHNLYGPTEASVDVSYFACQANSSYRSVPIGKPVANTQLHIFDDSLQAVPVGIIGELYIGGIQLARGYLNRDELTRNTFIDNPYFQSGHPSPRLYKTGDLVRYRPDGNIEYIGRSDFQVKVRGLRIELGEIESVLHRHASVKETIVVTKELAPGNVLIVAYIVKESATTPEISELRSHLSDHVPEYMIPNAFVFIDEIPLSANGKANRRALPDPDLEQLRGNEYVAPRSETEQQLADIWSNILGIEKVGVQDNFFELGGHSILAMQAANEAHEKFQIEIELAKIFETPTIEKIAELIDQALAEQSILMNSSDFSDDDSGSDDDEELVI